MQQMVAAILKLNESNSNRDKRISRRDYEQWRRKLVFDHLQGLRTGQSFCNQFDITDNLLFYNSLGADRIFQYIEEKYLK